MAAWTFALLYACVLFAFAAWAERRGGDRSDQPLRLPAYVLALAVYCTSWTYYGAVGTAVADGWSYLSIYLGPIIVLAFGHRFLVRLIDAVKSDGSSSISEFVGGRFNNSRGVAALVTLLALLGCIPYIALQLRAFASTYAMMAGTSALGPTMTVAAIGMTLFALIYGTRKYEAAGRTNAVLFAVGFESLVKIGALVLAGVTAFVLLRGADASATASAIGHLRTRFAPENIGADFFVITLLSMAAIICLPRQFYVTVIQADSSRDLLRARWGFIAYLFVTTLVVVPIAAAGLALLPAHTPPDRYVLQLALDQGLATLALVVFLGGVSAATAMVIVESLALATMVSNDLVAPMLFSTRLKARTGDLGHTLLMTRRVAIAVIMAAALWWALQIPEKQNLASIGLVAFAAMAQFAPALMLAVYGNRRDATAAMASLIAGLLVWSYTLALPLLDPFDFVARTEGTLLSPHRLLGIDGLSPISHGALWSIGTNLAVFILVTMRRVQPRALPTLLRDAAQGARHTARVGDLKVQVARFIGTEATNAAFVGIDDAAPVSRDATRRAERLIASVVGLPSARAFLRSTLFGAALTAEEIAQLLDETGQSLRFSKGLLAATLENIDPGVSVVDRDLNVVAWNSRYLDMFGYPSGMVHVGAPVASLIRYNAERGECGAGEVDEHVEKRLSHMRRGQQHVFERVRPDGRVFKTVGGPMPDGGYVMCFTDVTAEARAVAEIQRARAELEMRVENRTRDLRAANNALAVADAEKTRFLAAASHDLLQPLHAAGLFSAALRRDSSDQQRALIDRIDRSIASADALLRSLLDISKLDAGGITPQCEPIAVRPLLLELAETFAPLAREKGLSLRVGASTASVLTDPVLLRSIVQNFLSNAIRYTRAGGILMGVRRVGGEARIDVIDTGPGIAPEQQGLIFREFERLPESSEGGMGLGLAIVDRTARLLDVRVTLASVPGRGTRFSVSLPRITAVAAMPSRREQRADGVSTPRRVLVVDDDATNGDALTAFLATCGHSVTVARSATEALARGTSADSTAYDVALVDFNLGPGMDGLTLIDQLRAQGVVERCALVTAAQPEAYAARAEALRITVLTKPVSVDALVRWIDAASMDNAAAAAAE